MSEEETELRNRTEQGDVPSSWAIEEICRLVEKVNETMRENYQLRSNPDQMLGGLSGVNVTERLSAALLTVTVPEVAVMVKP